MRYKLELFNGFFYAVPVDLDAIYWQRFKDGKGPLPATVWVCDSDTETFIFEHPEIVRKRGRVTEKSTTTETRCW